MAKDSDRSRGEKSAADAQQTVVSERVQELTWALVDEQINNDEFRLLENLLLSDDAARSTYVGCMQLHVDLLSHFAAPPKEAAAKTASGSGILSFLNADPTLGLQSASGEEAVS